MQWCPTVGVLGIDVAPKLGKKPKQTENEFKFYMLWS